MNFMTPCDRLSPEQKQILTTLKNDCHTIVSIIAKGQDPKVPTCDRFSSAWQLIQVQFPYDTMPSTFPLLAHNELEQTVLEFYYP